MENIKENIIKQIKNTKLKNITLEEIYKSAKIAYSPEIAKQISTIIQELVAENILEPLKNSKKNSLGIHFKYRINPPKKDYINIKQEITKLNERLDIQYYLRHPAEYEEHKQEILKINDFIKIPNKGQELTVNERSYQIFKDEKRLKNDENILKKLGITYQDLNCYETYEPFFYFENHQCEKHKNKILIIENRDTFWSFKKVAEKNNKFYLIIYGEGKKILNSFEYLINFNLNENSEILYFGDIDYEGINIYSSLSQKHKSYKIKPYIEAYHKMLELENNAEKIRNNQNIREENIEEFLQYFSQEDKEKLIHIFKNKLYIPQEIINYEEVDKLV